MLVAISNYRIEITKVYQFPISTVENYQGDFDVEMLALSSDLGTTTFYNKMKGSELNRWIAKAVANNKFVKVV